ncbi:MAG: magnesium/cobalt transporter CorA [Alphaproteobacteria bacterium]
MIRQYTAASGKLVLKDNGLDDIENAVWIDLISPSNEEERALEKQLGIDVPTREEMKEIEISSRLYTEENAAFMTATIPAQSESDEPVIEPVTFVLVGNRLITVRYHEPRAFQTFAARAAKVSTGATSGSLVMVTLLETVVDRLADVLERLGRDIDGISRDVFQHRSAKPTKTQDFQEVLRKIGLKGDLTSNMRDSLVTIQRLIGFLGHVLAQRKAEKSLTARVKTLSRDAHSLTDHASFLSQKITFLLDATLGMINIEQNAIIKIFSVAAVVFLPPTLIASIYGMNFEHMPELNWLVGYPFALVLMVASAILPYWYFKRRGWL